MDQISAMAVRCQEIEEAFSQREEKVSEDAAKVRSSAESLVQENYLKFNELMSHFREAKRELHDLEEMYSDATSACQKVRRRAYLLPV